MNVTSIKFMKRKNLGNYEHEELSMEAVLQEGEDAGVATIALMSLVNQALQGEVSAAPAKTSNLEEVKVQLGPMGNEPAATATFLKEKVKEEKAKPAPRTRAAKKEEAPTESAVEGNVPPVIPQEEVTAGANAGGTSSVVGSVDTANVTHVQSEAPKTGASAGVVKGQVAYDAGVKEHRSRLATHLNTNYPKWKTFKPGDEVTKFSKELHGKAFENTKGEMLPEFKAELEKFFAAAK